MSTAVAYHSPLAYRISPRRPVCIPPPPSAPFRARPWSSRCAFWSARRLSFRRGPCALFNRPPALALQFHFFAHLDFCSPSNVSSPLPSYQRPQTWPSGFSSEVFLVLLKSLSSTQVDFCHWSKLGAFSQSPVEAVRLRPREAADLLLNPAPEAPDHVTLDK